MKIGIPLEIKAYENRVAIRPAGVEVLVRDGHELLVQSEAGAGSGFTDEEYSAAGARIVQNATDVWECDLIAKVKEPLPEEYPLLRADQIVFTFFHFAAEEQLTNAAIDSKIIGIAYETVQEPDGGLPLLVPMSEVAGRMAVQQGAKYLEKHFGGRGLLLSGVPGTPRAEVLVLGAGIVGSNAAKIAAGQGANVTVLDIDLKRLRQLDDTMPKNVSLLYSDPYTIRENLQQADLVIGAVLQPGKKAPQLVTREHLKIMQQGAVLVDVAIDQGGCIASSRPTTHENPTFIEEGIVHYCVSNMPGAVPRTSTFALTNATFPYLRHLAKWGWKEACSSNKALGLGLNVVRGKVVHPGVAEAFNLPHTPISEILS